MIADLKPYPALKDSGVPWLGEVPEHWAVRRIKTLFREKDERSGTGSGVLLSLTRAKGIVPQTEASKRIASAEDLSKYRVCRPGDLVMNRMQAWSGMFALSTYAGVISPDYSIFGAIDKSDVKFYEHLFKAPIVVDQFAQRSKGIGSGFNRLYTPDFGAVSAIVPPLSEQVAIVRFLDYADRRIRHYILAKQKLIKLLEEQKQAIIHRAVTRGLSPNVRLKPSGVEWLGDVPEHWEVKRNGRLFAQRNQTGFGDLPILEVSLKTGVRIRAFDNSIRKQVMSDRGKYKRAAKGDIAYNMMRMWQGAVGVAPVDGLVSPAYVVARPFEGVEVRYFSNLFRTSAYMREVDSCPRGIVKDRNRLYWEDFKQIFSPCPPLDDQIRIAEAIDENTRTINGGIGRTLAEIDLLREFRTRLIADVVTGKLDVRAAAAKLPDETDESELLDDAEVLTEGGEETEDTDLDAVTEEAEA
ncbi:MAG: hypothetical protein CAF45_002970 [Nitrospira sp. CG24E]|nr:MAG: hypothetical protein CAF45_002970 [Nitrospira sp. CG24E]